MNPWTAPHYNVTLTMSAGHLKPGEFEIVGYFYPQGFLGPREERYRQVIPSRTRYDQIGRRIRRQHGNTPVAAEALYQALKPCN